MRAKHFETVSQELHHKFHHIFHHRFHHRFHHNFIIARAEFFVSNWDSGRNYYTGIHHLSPEASRRRIAMASLPPTCTTPVRHSQYVAIVLKPYISVSETHKTAVVEATFICKPVEQAVAAF